MRNFYKNENLMKNGYLKINIFERPVGIIRTRWLSEKLMSPRDSAYLIYYKKTILDAKIPLFMNYRILVTGR